MVSCEMHSQLSSRIYKNGAKRYVTICLWSRSSGYQWLCCSLLALIAHLSPQNLLTCHLIYQLLVRALGFSEPLSLIIKHSLGTHPNRGERALFFSFFSQENGTTRRLLPARNLLICFPKEEPQTGKGKCPRNKARKGACPIQKLLKGVPVQAFWRAGVQETEAETHHKQRAIPRVFEQTKRAGIRLSRTRSKALSKIGLRTSYPVQKTHRIRGQKVGKKEAKSQGEKSHKTQEKNGFKKKVFKTMWGKSPQAL